ncbi:MAG TPA: CHASE2 domain-containing protein, partial [Rhizomicrobium sp.]|nr:CHASE2 domain-containing protein [Rhizomicrobium sp.]
MTWPCPRSVWLAPALVLALGVCVILFDVFGVPTTLGNHLFDAYQRHAARPFAGAPVRVLELPALDEDSLVRTARTLTQQGASLMVLAAPMEPGPSPQSMAAKLPPGSDAARAALAHLPEPGHDLAQALQDIKGVVPVVLGIAGRAPRIKARFVYHGTAAPFAFVPRFSAAAAAPTLLETNAAGSAAANLMPDADGVVRRMPLVFHLGASLVPGLAVETLRVANDAADIAVTSNERDPLTFLEGVGIGALQLPGREIATSGDGRIRLHFAANTSERMLNPNALNAVPLKDAIVVIGAAGAAVQTPLGPASAASVTAEGIENLLTGAVLTRPAWMFLCEALALAVLGTATILLLRFGLGWPAALAMAGIVALFLLSWMLFAQHGILMDAATPALGVGLAFAAGAIAWIHDMRLAYAGLRMAFSDSLPRATIEKIARRPHLLKLEGETR